MTITYFRKKEIRHRRWYWLITTGMILTVAAPLILRSLVSTRYANAIYVGSVQALQNRTAVVFGAAVRGEYPTDMLRDRLDTAIELYHDGMVDHLLLSGDGHQPGYDEPGVMARYAMAQGVPHTALILDRLGLRTYDTCFRAREVHNLQQVVLVTQAFHLPRALFTCECLGLDVLGLSADRRTYRRAYWYDLRELLALTVAIWDVVTRPFPNGGVSL